MGHPVGVHQELERWLGELNEFVGIPSVSAEPGHSADVWAAGAWLCKQLRAIGGSAELIDRAGQPLAIGEVHASMAADRSPTVLVYGHVDVQPAEPTELWSTPPFRATILDGWVYGRGTADDKGHLLMFIEALHGLLEVEQLPVNVRFICDGEEETLGKTAVEYLIHDERVADACVIFDAPMLKRDRPVMYVGARGIAYFHVRVTTGTRELHSGQFGGAAMNATHALVQALNAVLPHQGRLPAPLRTGLVPIASSDWSDASSLRSGSEALAAEGALPADEQAADEFYRRVWAEPSVDVHGIAGGSTHVQKSAIPTMAESNLSIRLGPGQDVEPVAAAIECLLRAGAPAGADVQVTLLASCPPGLTESNSPVIRIGQDAIEATCGMRPLLIRAGGTLPVLGALSAKGIPTILTGFDLPEGNIHAPDERLLLDYVPLGIATARELFLRLSALPVVR